MKNTNNIWIQNTDKKLSDNIMAYKDLRNFIEKLEQDGDLIRVKTPVSTHLEMTEIQTRVIRDKGPAIL